MLCLRNLKRRSRRLAAEDEDEAGLECCKEAALDMGVPRQAIPYFLFLY
jgi:hypothetical protein